MNVIYIINYDYAHEKYDVYERGAECAYTDLNQAKKRLKELTQNLKAEFLEKYDEEDIVEDVSDMSYSIYQDYRYDEHHTDYWIDEIELMS